MIDPALDHLVLATPDLAATVAEVADRCGTAPVRGGSHVDRGTANWLVGLSPTSYLEIVGPDPEQPPPASPRPFGIDDLDRTRLVTWAVHPPSADAVRDRARAAGDDPGELTPMSRRTPAGDLLQWRLTPDRGVLPFLIDWADTPHPATTLPRIGLVSLTVRHPTPDVVQRQLSALGVAADVVAGGEPSLEAVFSTPGGLVSTDGFR